MVPGFGVNCFSFYGSYSWIGWAANLIPPVLLVGGLIWLFVWAVRRAFPGTPNISGGVQLGAREILKMRYARGEVTREQYQQMSRDLE